MRLTRSYSPLAAVIVMLLLLPGCTAAAAPNPPEIVSLTAREDVVAPLDSCLVECVAEDKDGDTLTYSWSADSGTINGYAGTVAWTAPATEGIYKISVDVSDGSDLPPATATVTIRVKDNHYPSIDGMGADKDWVKPGETCTITCEASDIDGDPLQYSWEADNGQVDAVDGVATWTAPDFEGYCTVRVIVSDGFGGQHSASVEIRVAKAEPLVVTDMIVTPVDEPQYLKAYDERYKILRGKRCIIQCVVNHPERIVSYEWTDGAPATVFPVGSDRFIFESPDAIRWTAPQDREEYVIKVVARDADGHSAEKSITLQVETCTCAFSSSENTSGADQGD